jgi:hypothetical protein
MKNGDGGGSRRRIGESTSGGEDEVEGMKRTEEASGRCWTTLNINDERRESGGGTRGRRRRGRNGRDRRGIREIRRGRGRGIGR